ncbi:MAG: mechanosensitive ion channel domain-containing protein [Bacteroidota bacterium]
MDELKHWTDIAQNLLVGLSAWLPKIFGALLILLVGWMIARVLRTLISKGLRLARFNVLMGHLGIDQLLKKGNIKKDPSGMFGQFVYWFIMLIVLVAFTDGLGLEIVSQKIGLLINYLPNVLVALIIVIVGFYAANLVRETIFSSFGSYGIKGSRLVGNMIFYLLMVFILLTALDQLQFNVALLTSNIMILLGGIALAFAIAYGLSAKEIFPHMISSYYSKGIFEVGQTIKIGEVEGEILEITNLSVVLKTLTGRYLIPAKRLLTEDVQILEKI